MSPLDDSPASYTREALADLLDGDHSQKRRLAQLVIDYVTPAVASELRFGTRGPASRDDLIAEVVLYLYRNEARVLRAWDPSIAPLPGYLRMIARRLVRKKLAAVRPTVSLDDAPDPSAAGHRVVGANSEVVHEHRAALDRLAEWLYEHGSPTDLRRFRALFVEGRSRSDVATREGTTIDAIHTWASRLRQRLQRGLPEIVRLLDGDAKHRRKRP